jgi:hypothetical protein
MAEWFGCKLGWWFMRLISRLKLIYCERKTLFHGWNLTYADAYAYLLWEESIFRSLKSSDEVVKRTGQVQVSRVPGLNDAGPCEIWSDMGVLNQSKVFLKKIWRTMCLWVILVAKFLWCPLIHSSVGLAEGSRCKRVNKWFRNSLSPFRLVKFRE